DLALGGIRVAGADAEPVGEAHHQSDDEGDAGGDEQIGPGQEARQGAQEAAAGQEEGAAGGDPGQPAPKAGFPHPVFLPDSLWNIIVTSGVQLERLRSYEDPCKPSLENDFRRTTSRLPISGWKRPPRRTSWPGRCRRSAAGSPSPGAGRRTSPSST